MEAAGSTIVVRVRFTGDLIAVTGKREVVVTLPLESTVADLMLDLSMTYGEAFTARVFSSPAKLNHHVLLFVDGQKLQQRDGLATKLGNSETEIILLPMFGGG